MVCIYYVSGKNVFSSSKSTVLVLSTRPIYSYIYFTVSNIKIFFTPIHSFTLIPTLQHMLYLSKKLIICDLLYYLCDLLHVDQIVGSYELQRVSWGCYAHFIRDCEGWYLIWLSRWPSTRGLCLTITPAGRGADRTKPA